MKIILTLRTYLVPNVDNPIVRIPIWQETQTFETHVIGDFTTEKKLIVYVITDNFHHLLMKFYSYVQTHFYIPNDKNWTVDVKFYHLLQTVAHKQLTTEDCSLSP